MLIWIIGLVVLCIVHIIGTVLFAQDLWIVCRYAKHDRARQIAQQAIWVLTSVVVAAASARVAYLLYVIYANGTAL